MKQTQIIEERNFQIVKTHLDESQYLVVLMSPIITTNTEIQKDLLAIFANIVNENENYTIMQYSEEYFKGQDWILQSNSSTQNYIHIKNFLSQFTLGLNQSEPFLVRFTMDINEKQQEQYKKIEKAIHIVNQINEQLQNGKIENDLDSAIKKFVNNIQKI